jgi:hypothetical protein
MFRRMLAPQCLHRSRHSGPVMDSAVVPQEPVFKENPGS